MNPNKGLWKRVIIIWSEEDPSDMDIEDVSVAAMRGDAHLALDEIEFVDDPERDPDWDAPVADEEDDA